MQTVDFPNPAAAAGQANAHHLSDFEGTMLERQPVVTESLFDPR